MPVYGMYYIRDVVNMLTKTPNEGKSSREHILKDRSNVQTLSFIFPRGGIIPSLLPAVNTGLNTRDAIEGGPNIETEHGAAVGKGRGGVVVDDVSEFFACLWTVDNPVVSVKWRLRAVGTYAKVRKLRRVG